MTSADRADQRHVAVIGAGTVGSCCAWHLGRAGYRVSLVDPVDPGQSTSFGNAGIISTSHITPFSYPGVTREIPGWLFDRLGPLFIRWRDFPGLVPWFWRFWRSATSESVRHCCEAQARLMHLAVADFDELLEGAGCAALRRERGTITIYDQRADLEKERWKYDLKDELGFEWQHLSPSEVKIMVPELNLGDGVATYNPEWQYVLDPGEITARIAESCFQRGGTWVRDQVDAVHADDNGVSLITRSNGTLKADALVVAAGAWSNRIARQLDYTVPMTAKRGYHAMVGDPGIELDYPVMSMSRTFVMTPMQGGLRFAGTAEFARLDAEPDYSRARVLLEHARHYLPNLQCEDVTEWMGQRPMMADSLPVISPSPSRRNVFYAFGHGHYGLTQGPTTGKVIEALVSGHEPHVDIHDYRFSRFKD